jgi:predicted NAD-dependent protein-ADP-ribosyltransferase YbiA (DUF1768 family)
MAEAFTFFWKSRLSQWHRSPFVLGGVSFTHAEQYMMYGKALLFWRPRLGGTHPRGRDAA